MAMAHEPTLYDVIGAHPVATPSQIRQAYRKAAIQWHPDKAHAEDKRLAEARFKKISEANEILSDPSKRHLYDLYLQCRERGVVEMADRDDPYGPPLLIPVRGWDEFARQFGHHVPGFMPKHYEEDTPDP